VVRQVLQNNLVLQVPILLQLAYTNHLSVFNAQLVLTVQVLQLLLQDYVRLVTIAQLGLQL